MTSIANIQRRVVNINTANGWRDTITLEDVNWQITQLALITTEVAEAIEELRAGREADETHYPTRPYVDEHGVVQNAYSEAPWKPEGVPSELADVIIRALDCADLFGIDIEAAIDEKLRYNASRGYRHGGKTA